MCVCMYVYMHECIGWYRVWFEFWVFCYCNSLEIFTVFEKSKFFLGFNLM